MSTSQFPLVKSTMVCLHTLCSRRWFRCSSTVSACSMCKESTRRKACGTQQEQFPACPVLRSLQTSDSTTSQVCLPQWPVCQQQLSVSLHTGQSSSLCQTPPHPGLCFLPSFCQNALPQQHKLKVCLCDGGERNKEGKYKCSHGSSPLSNYYYA